MALPTATRSGRSRGVLYGLLVVCLLFVIIGLGMIASGTKDGIGVTAFFGACTGISVWQLWPHLFETERRSPEVILAAYPGPVVMHGSARKHLLLAAVTGVFGAAGLWMLLNEPLSPVLQVLLWPGTVMFVGLAPLVLLIAILGTSLQLDETGLTIRQPWRRIDRRWPDAYGFVAVEMSGTVSGASSRFVAFEDATVDETRIVSMNRTITGRNAGLPDTFGLDPDALAALLNTWRARALRNGAEGSSPGRPSTHAAEATAGEILFRAFLSSALPRKAWASSLRSKTWGATPRLVRASSIFRRRKALVA